MSYYYGLIWFLLWDSAYLGYSRLVLADPQWCVILVQQREVQQREMSFPRFQALAGNAICEALPCRDCSKRVVDCFEKLVTRVFQNNQQPV